MAASAEVPSWKRILDIVCILLSTPFMVAGRDDSRAVD